MENNELQLIWKDAGRELRQKSRDELNLLLANVTRQTINKFLVTIGAGVLAGAGLVIFLCYTSLHRSGDLLYLINNITLGVISLISITAGLASWKRLNNKKTDQPLRSWLEVRISYLSKLVSRKLNRMYIFILPVIYLLTVLSIHVYFENRPFLEVLGTGESLTGMIAGAPIGLFVAFVVSRKIRKNELANLEFLKDLHARLSDIN